MKKEKFIAKDLIAYRENLGFTRDELARELKTTYTTIYRWETGQREIPQFLELALHTIANELGAIELAHRELTRIVQVAKKKKIVDISDEKVTEILNLIDFRPTWRGIETNPKKGKEIRDSLDETNKE